MHSCSLVSLPQKIVKQIIKNNAFSLGGAPHSASQIVVVCLGLTLRSHWDKFCKTKSDNSEFLALLLSRCRVVVANTYSVVLCIRLSRDPKYLSCIDLQCKLKGTRSRGRNEIDGIRHYSPGIWDYNPTIWDHKVRDGNKEKQTDR